jgi:hypothetical protein
MLSALMMELRGDDPGRWGHSLANLAEILIPLLDAAEAKSVAEVGAYAGDLTRVLLEWADSTGGRVTAIDPKPQEELLELARQRVNMELLQEPSEDALVHLNEPDAVIIDGDHNYYTVSAELGGLSDRLDTPGAPLVLLHDVCWPHARRDAYYVPERIPESGRRPMVEGGGLVPGEPGIVHGGLPYKWVAEREGGERNGVLTALEDFLRSRPMLRSATVPAFFGLGVIWHREAPWADAVAAVLEPWDSNPVVARLEENRVYHLTQEYRQRPKLLRLEALNQNKTALLKGLMESRSFRLAERLSRLRNPRRSSSWREDAERLIDQDD